MENITYCFDRIKPYLDVDVDFSVYPYMVVLVGHSFNSDSFMVYPDVHLSMFNPVMYNEAMAFFIHDDVSGNTVDVMSEPHKVTNPLDRRYFKRWGDITPPFKIPFRDVSCVSSTWIRYKDHVKVYGSNNGIYRKSEVRISKTHTLKSYKENTCTLGIGEHDSNIIIYDDTNKFSYMFDRKLSEMITSDVDNSELVISRAFTSPELDENSNLDIAHKKFYSHILHFKSHADASRYRSYFNKHHNYQTRYAMSEYADNSVNKRLSNVKRISDEIEIRTGEVERPEALYDITFDWCCVEDNGIEESVISYIKNNGIYSNIIDDSNTSQEDDIVVGIDDIHAILKLKLVPVWIECVSEIIVSDRE